jgi:hypothetical protein
VGWTALQFPWIDYPLKEEELAVVNSHGMPPKIEGMNMKVLLTFIKSLSFAGEHGYEPQTDYHKNLSLQSPYKLIVGQIERKQWSTRTSRREALDHFLCTTVMPLRTRWEARLGCLPDLPLLRCSGNAILGMWQLIM